MNQNSQSGPNVNISGLLREKEKREVFRILALKGRCLTCIKINEIGYHLSQQNDTHLTSNPSHPRALEHRSPFQTTRLLPEQQLGFHQGSVMVPNATRMALWFIQHFLNPKDVSQCLHLRHYKRMVLMMSFQLCNSLAHF